VEWDEVAHAAKGFRKGPPGPQCIS
jgi:hypothetical protein